MVLPVEGMSRLLVSLLIVLSLRGFAAADQIIVTADRAEDAAVVQQALDRWAAGRQLDAARRADVGVVRLVIESIGADTSIVAELTAAVCDGRSEMRSVLSSSARVTVRAGELRAKGLPTFRREALLSATEALLPKLAAELGAPTQVAER